MMTHTGVIGYEPFNITKGVLCDHVVIITHERKMLNVILDKDDWQFKLRTFIVPEKFTYCMN